MGVIVFYGELSLRGLDVFPPLHVCEVFSLVAPPIGESCGFDAMISYSIILKSKV